MASDGLLGRGGSAVKRTPEREGARKEGRKEREEEREGENRGILLSQYVQ